MICMKCRERIHGANKHKIHGIWHHKKCPGEQRMKTYTAREIPDDIHKVWKLMSAVYGIKMSEVLEAGIMSLWFNREKQEPTVLAKRAKVFSIGGSDIRS